jgi:hypothetical protein
MAEFLEQQGRVDAVHVRKHFISLRSGSSQPMLNICHQQRRKSSFGDVMPDLQYGCRCN